MRILVGFLLCTVLVGQTDVEKLWERKFVADVEAYAKGLDGVVGLAAIDLTTGRTVCFQCDALFPTASSIKIPILIAMFRAARAGEFKFEDKLTLRKEDMVGGSGHLNKSIEKDPLALTVRELVTAMMETSDNTATNRCIRMVGMDRVNRILDELDLPGIRLRRVMMDSKAGQASIENVATPREMARLVEMIHRGTASHPDDCRAMLDIMRLVKGGMNKGLPAEMDVASKTGAIPGVKNQVGVVYLKDRPFVLSIYGSYLGNAELDPVLDLTKVAWKYFERLGRGNRYGHLVR